MRRHDTKQLASLLELAELKVSLAQVEVSRLATAMTELDRRIGELSSKTFSVETPQASAVFHNWQEWRKGKLRQLGISKAKLAAAHREASKHMGRLSAEREVLAELLKREAKAVGLYRVRRSNYVS